MPDDTSGHSRPVKAAGDLVYCLLAPRWPLMMDSWANLTACNTSGTTICFRSPMAELLLYILYSSPFFTSILYVALPLVSCSLSSALSQSDSNEGSHFWASFSFCNLTLGIYNLLTLRGWTSSLSFLACALVPAANAITRSLATSTSSDLLHPGMFPSTISYIGHCIHLAFTSPE